MSDFKIGRVRLNPTFMSFVFKFKFHLEELLGVPLLVALTAYPPLKYILGYLLLLLLRQADRRGAIRKPAEPVCLVWMLDVAALPRRRLVSSRLQYRTTGLL